MKSSIKKLFVACAAVSAITAVSAMSASALTATPDTEANSVKVALGSSETVSGETTILVFKGTAAVPADEDIIYINQADAEDAKSSNGFLAPNGTVLPMDGSLDVAEGEEQVYTVRVADQYGTNGYYETTFKVGGSGGDDPDFVYGDVDLNTKVNTADANLALRYATREAGLVLSDVQQKAADVDLNTKINTADANYILRYATREAGLVLPVTK